MLYADCCSGDIGMKSEADPSSVEAADEGISEAPYGLDGSYVEHILNFFDASRILCDFLFTERSVSCACEAS